MRQSRYPKIGDILIVRMNREDDDGYVGVVRKIVLDRWQHQKNVFVVWQGDVAPNYNREHGYSGVNIHNLRSEFRVIRKGIDIP